MKDKKKKKKEIVLDNCPIHHCQPICYGQDVHKWQKFVDLPEDFDTSPFKRTDRIWVHDKWHVLSKLFPDAMIFDCNYTVFCSECAKKNPFPGKHNKFGYGFTSQYYLRAAQKNWNGACMRYYVSSVKNDLKDV